MVQYANKFCALCGAEFIPNRWWSKYCSSEHRQLSYYKRQADRYEKKEVEGPKMWWEQKNPMAETKATNLADRAEKILTKKSNNVEPESPLDSWLRLHDDTGEAPRTKHKCRTCGMQLDTIPQQTDGFCCPDCKEIFDIRRQADQRPA